VADIYGLGRLEADLNGVRVDNIRATIRDLRMFSPALLKEMNEEIKDVTEPVTTLAKRYATQAGRSMGAPLSRWNNIPRRPGSRGEYAPAQGRSGAKRWEYQRLQWNTGKVKAGIRTGPGGFRFANNLNIGTSDRWTSLWAIRNSNAAGAVYELMGTGAAQTAITRTVPRTSGVKGKRLIWRAWDELNSGATVPAKIEQVVVNYVGQFNERLRLVGPRRPMRKRQTYTATPTTTV